MKKIEPEQPDFFEEETIEEKYDGEWYLQRFQERLSLLQSARNNYPLDGKGLAEIHLSVERITSVVVQATETAAGTVIDLLIDDNPNKCPQWGTHEQILNCYHLADDYDRHLNGLLVQNSAGDLILIIHDFNTYKRYFGAEVFVKGLKRYGIYAVYNVYQDMYGRIKNDRFNPESDIFKIEEVI